jgi:hypothetical protein
MRIARSEDTSGARTVVALAFTPASCAAPSAARAVPTAPETPLAAASPPAARVKPETPLATVAPRVPCAMSATHVCDAGKAGLRIAPTRTSADVGLRHVAGMR